MLNFFKRKKTETTQPTENQKTITKMITIDPLSEIKLKIEKISEEINEFLQDNVTLHYNKIPSAKIYYLYSGVYYHNFGPNKFSDSCYVFDIGNDIKYILYKEKVKEEDDDDVYSMDQYSHRNLVFMTRMPKDEFEEKLRVKKSMYRENYHEKHDHDSPENLVVIDMIHRSVNLEKMISKGNIADLTGLYSTLENGKRNLLNTFRNTLIKSAEQQKQQEDAAAEQREIKEKEENIKMNELFKSFKT